MEPCPLSEWSTGLEKRGLYFEGIVDSAQLDRVLELHKRDTVSTFGTRSSRRVAEPRKQSQASKVATSVQQAAVNDGSQKENTETEKPVKTVRSLPTSSESVHDFMIVIVSMHLHRIFNNVPSLLVDRVLLGCSGLTLLVAVSLSLKALLSALVRNGSLTASMVSSTRDQSLIPAAESSCKGAKRKAVEHILRQQSYSCTQSTVQRLK